MGPPRDRVRARRRTCARTWTGHDRHGESRLARLSECLGGRSRWRRRSTASSTAERILVLLRLTRARQDERSGRWVSCGKEGASLFHVRGGAVAEARRLHGTATARSPTSASHRRAAPDLYSERRAARNPSPPPEPSSPQPAGGQPPTFPTRSTTGHPGEPASCVKHSSWWHSPTGPPVSGTRGSRRLAHLSVSDFDHRLIESDHALGNAGISVFWSSGLPVLLLWGSVPCRGSARRLRGCEAAAFAP